MSFKFIQALPTYFFFLSIVVASRSFSLKSMNINNFCNVMTQSTLIPHIREDNINNTSNENVTNNNKL